MDATRARRTRDRARQGWYARHRQWRFARHLGFGDGIEPPAARPESGPPARLGRSAIGIRTVAALDAVDSTVAPSLCTALGLAMAGQ